MLFSLALVAPRNNVYHLNATCGDRDFIINEISQRNSPEALVHEILNGGFRCYPHAVFVKDRRPVNPSILGFEHLEKIADVMSYWPEDKLALFITARQWTDDVG